jgi:hypothetical protein
MAYLLIGFVYALVLITALAVRLVLRGALRHSPDGSVPGLSPAETRDFGWLDWLVVHGDAEPVERGRYLALAARVDLRLTATRLRPRDVDQLRALECPACRAPWGRGRRCTTCRDRRGRPLPLARRATLVAGGFARPAPETTTSRDDHVPGHRRESG